MRGASAEETVCFYKRNMLFESRSVSRSLKKRKSGKIKTCCFNSQGDCCSRKGRLLLKVKLHLNKRKKSLFQFKKAGTAVKYVGKCEMKFNAGFAEMRRGKNAEVRNFWWSKSKLLFPTSACILCVLCELCVTYCFYSRENCCSRKGRFLLKL